MVTNLTYARKYAAILLKSTALAGPQRFAAVCIPLQSLFAVFGISLAGGIPKTIRDITPSLFEP